MKSNLYVAALLFAVLIGVLVGTSSAWASSEEKTKAEEDADRKQEVWDMQVRYASYAGGAACLGFAAFWLLSTSDQRKKKYKAELKKMDKLDPDEGMAIH